MIFSFPIRPCLLMYLNIDVMENSAHVMHSRICCATILVIFCPLKNFVMHRHITYFTQSTVWISFYESIFSNNFFSSSPWAYAGFAKGGQGGSGHASPKQKLNGAIWCVLEHIFIKNFTFKKSKNIHCIQK